MEIESAPSAHGFSRRSMLKRGAAVTALVGAASVAGDMWAEAPWAYADSDKTGTRKGLGTGTAPEQVHLTFGADPTSEMWVSFVTPTAAPAPTVTIGSTVITPTLSSYVDGGNSETVYSYRAHFTGLTAGTTYSYTVSDGASTPNTFTQSFKTAPSGRFAYTFTSFGDLGTPAADKNLYGISWNESSDNAWLAPQALEQVAPDSLFHVLNGDLCYANLNWSNQPEVWRDYAVNNQVSSSKKPWMPCYGNHEVEFGSNDQSGSTGASSGRIWNGPGGYASVFNRYPVPDNGQGDPFSQLFYAFQVGTVLFISLSADDVIYQDGAANYVNGGSTAALNYSNRPSTGDPINNGTTLYNREFTGGLVPVTDGDGNVSQLVPGVDSSSGATGNGGAFANKQTTWLKNTLAAARAGGSSVDMIVVSIHQCALSTSTNGNGSDLGIRQAWLPLFDQYSVDLVVNGHDHDYERTYPVRGYLPGKLGTVGGTGTAPNPGLTAGTPTFTRTPARVAAAGPFSTQVGGSTYSQAFDTSQGTVFLTLGGGGTNGPTNAYKTAADGSPQAKVITTRNLVLANSGGGYTKYGADSTEPALWSAKTDTAEAFGFSVFHVDPGTGPGQTSIVMQYYHAPQVSGSGFTLGSGDSTAEYTVLETVVFGRALVNTAPPAALPEFGVPAVAAAAGLAIGGAALVAARKRAAADVS